MDADKMILAENFDALFLELLLCREMLLPGAPERDAADLGIACIEEGQDGELRPDRPFCGESMENQRAVKGTGRDRIELRAAPVR